MCDLSCTIPLITIIRRITISPDGKFKFPSRVGVQLINLCVVHHSLMPVFFVMCVMFSACA